LTLNPTKVELAPNETISVKAIVKNLVDLPDRISLSIKVPADADVNAIVIDPSIVNATPKGNIEFDLKINAKNDAQKDTIALTIMAVSEKAAENGHVVREEAVLTVIILETDKPGTDKSTSSNTIGSILFLIIIIILFISFIIFIYSRKKKQKVKDEREGEEEDLLQETEETKTEPTDENLLQDTESTLPVVDALLPVPVPVIEEPTEPVPVPMTVKAEKPQLPLSTIEVPSETSESIQAQSSDDETQIEQPMSEEQPESESKDDEN
jgi:cbb3-type cytochrome oxidase subunit 3